MAIEDYFSSEQKATHDKVYKSEPSHHDGFSATGVGVAVAYEICKMLNNFSEYREAIYAGTDMIKTELPDLFHRKKLPKEWMDTAATTSENMMINAATAAKERGDLQ